MIISIESSIATFKPVFFHTGLNVLLADTNPGSTNKQTRNSAGKTSLLEIIHFLLGADCGKESLFRTPALLQESFLGTFKILGENIKVSRTGSDPSKIFLIDGWNARKELPVKIDKDSERPYVSNANWKTYLGHAMFGLPADIRGSLYDETGSPTFRAMFAYFARRRNSGAFLYPERQSESQQRSDWQINLSYLLGLDWQIPLEFHRVRQREKTLEELRKAAKGGALGNVIGTVAELRPQVTVAETRAEQLRKNLENFEVLESYSDLSRRAAKAKSDMQALSRKVIGLYETLEHLERALAAETPPTRSDLQNLYQEIGIELPSVALRRFEEVTMFHDSIISNRKHHLDEEMRRVKIDISNHEERQSDLDMVRQGILKTLDGRGALEDFIRLQRELANLEVSAASLRERFKAAEMLEGESAQLNVDRASLKQRLQDDHRTRQDILSQAILIVSELIEELYDDRAGNLVVDATNNGPEFRISIEGDRGGGIANMEIFCLDLTMYKLVSDRLGGPKFLFHDSHLFDGVDVRQVARALSLGASRISGGDEQYIVTMNSDIFDNLPLGDEVVRDKVVLKTRLSDETETGGLFGFRFN